MGELPTTILQAWLLLVLVNAAPILARDLLGRCCDWPLDLGLRLADGYPVLGHSKTWRGVLSAVAAGAATGAWLGTGAGTGAAVGLLAMLGDSISSFIKRRMGLAPSARFRGLDQWPESLLPLCLLRQPLGLDLPALLLVVLLFTLFEWWISPLLHRLRIRQRPW
jgi:CDP-2,3-bis-(O-geranylgeranyl)-sn-glycerol synthase